MEKPLKIVCQLKVYICIVRTNIISKGTSTMKQLMKDICMICYFDEGKKTERHHWKDCKAKYGKCQKCQFKQSVEMIGGQRVFKCPNEHCNEFRIPSPDEKTICYFCLFPVTVGAHKNKNGMSTCSYRPNELKFILTKIYNNHRNFNNKPFQEFVAEMMKFNCDTGLYGYQGWLINVLSAISK